MQAPPGFQAHEVEATAGRVRRIQKNCPHCALLHRVGCLLHSLDVVSPLELAMQLDGGTEASTTKIGGLLPQALSGRRTAITQKAEVLAKPSIISAGTGLPQNGVVL